LKSKKYQLLHNPRCSKSRKCLEFLKSNEVDFEIVLYLKKKLTINEIKNILEKSGLKAINLIRQNEKIWKEILCKKSLNENQIIQAICDNPEILKRPIFVSKTKSIIAIPPQESLKIL